MSKLSSVQISEIIVAGVVGCALLIIGGLRLSNPDKKDEKAERRKARVAKTASAAFKANESRFTNNEYKNPESESDAKYAYKKGQKMSTTEYLNDGARGLTHKRKSKKTHAKGKQSKRKK